MTRFCPHFRGCIVLSGAAYSFFLSIPAHAAVTTSWNTNSSGNFTFAANWDNGVPGPDDTAEFNRGAGVVYTVTFPGGNYSINLFHVHTNDITFADDGSPSSLTLASPAVIGESAGDVAILTTSLSNLSGTQAFIGQAPGSNGTAIVTGTGSTWTNSDRLRVGLGGTGTLRVEAGGSVSNWINSGSLSVGESGTGTLTIEDGGHLEMDSLAVNSELLFTAGLLEVRGGSITGLTSLVVPASGELRTSGVHSFRFTGLAGSTITATGSLTLGDATKVNGFYTSGTIDAGANNVTLADTNDVVFDSGALASLGNGASPGTLSAANGLTLDFGGNITGFGTVSTPNNAAKPLINNGHITGNSPAQTITLPGYVKGVGTLDNVNLTGTYSPGLSPTTSMVGNLAFSPTSTLIMEIGGTSAGSQYDQLIASGSLLFDGTMQISLINSFAPALGNTFNLFDWQSVSGTFDTLNLPALSGSLAWDTSQLYIDGTLKIASADLPGDFNHDGAVNAADYVVWRKGVGVESTPANYDLWRSNFGRTAAGAAPPSDAAVPEPNRLALLLLLPNGFLARYRNRAAVKNRS